MDQKGLKMHEKRQKLEFLDLKNLLFSRIFHHTDNFDHHLNHSNNFDHHDNNHNNNPSYLQTILSERTLR